MSRNGLKERHTPGQDRPLRCSLFLQTVSTPAGGDADIYIITEAFQPYVGGEISCQAGLARHGMARMLQRETNIHRLFFIFFYTHNDSNPNQLCLSFVSKRPSITLSLCQTSGECRNPIPSESEVMSSGIFNFGS